MIAQECLLLDKIFTLDTPNYRGLIAGCVTNLLTVAATSCATMEFQNRIAQLIQLYSFTAGYEKGEILETVGV